MASKREIGDAQRAFELVVARQADEVIPGTIGHPSGQHHDNLYWLAGVGIWAYFGLPPNEKSPGRRFWNAFGLHKPNGTVSIACEINPPMQGIDRRPSGAFGEAAGELYVLHRGTLNAYRGRIPKAYVRAEFRGNWVFADDGDRRTELLSIGSLKDITFVAKLAAFIGECVVLKTRYKGRA